VPHLTAVWDLSRDCTSIVFFCVGQLNERAHSDSSEIQFIQVLRFSWQLIS